jgi:predicted outer membrane repeat protein
MLTGSTVSNNTADSGGGIYNQGTVTLSWSIVSGNTAPDGGGGGIYNPGPQSVAVTNSLVIGNQAENGGQGGGIYSTGALTLTNAIVTFNTATGGLGSGGGIYWTGGTLNGSTAGVTHNTPDNGFFGHIIRTGRTRCSIHRRVMQCAT